MVLFFVVWFHQSFVESITFIANLNFSRFTRCSVVHSAKQCNDISKYVLIMSVSCKNLLEKRDNMGFYVPKPRDRPELSSSDLKISCSHVEKIFCFVTPEQFLDKTYGFNMKFA